MLKIIICRVDDVDADEDEDDDEAEDVLDVDDTDELPFDVLVPVVVVVLMSRPQK